MLIMLKLAIVITLTPIAICSFIPRSLIAQDILTFAEVEIDGIKKYVEIKGNFLEIPIKDHKIIRVRVDSLSSLKPSKVFLDDQRLFPSLNKGIFICEDLLEVNLSKLSVKGNILRVEFEKYPPKPIMYMLMFSKNEIREIKKDHVILKDKEPAKPWGAYVIALVTDKDLWKTLIEGKYTLINISEHKISLNYVNKSNILFELSYIVSNYEFKLNKSAMNKVVLMYYIPLYYFPLNSTEKPFIPEKLIKNLEKKYIYINVPGIMRITNFTPIMENNFLKLFNKNPLVIKVEKINSLNFAFRPIKITTDKDVLLIVSVNGKIYKNKGSLNLNISFPVSLIYLKMFRFNELIGEYILTSLIPEIHLKPKLYNVSFTFFNKEGEYINNDITIKLYKDFSEKIFKIKNGTLKLNGFPPGKYVIVVLKEGVEIFRGTFKLNKNKEIPCYCDVSSLKVRVTTYSGHPIKNFKLIANGPLTVESNGTQGEVYLKDIPLGNYTLSFLVDGIIFLKRNVSLASFTEISIKSDIEEVYIRFFNMVGHPISNLKALIIDSEGRTIKEITNSHEASISLYLLINKTYMLKIPALNYEYHFKVTPFATKLKVKVPCLLVIGGKCYDFYLILLALVLIVVLISVWLIKKKRDVIVLVERVNI